MLNKIDLNKPEYEEFCTDEFYKLFNGIDCLNGTNFEYINEQIDILKSKGILNENEQIQLNKYYSEIKRTKNGNRKPKTCWDFIHNGRCIHCNSNDKNHGIIIGNKWHPENEERIYLKKIKNKK